MTWSTYLSFLVFAVVVILVPGPDFAVVLKNALSGGRARGVAAGAGVGLSNAVQGVAAVAGLGALVVASQPLFLALKWAGVAYLAYLGVQALRSAVRSRYVAPADGPADRGGVTRGLRQGFLSNITNPKVLAFYLAVLPQFLPAHPSVGQALLLALTHAVLSFGYLVVLVCGVHRTRTALARRRVRRTLDAVTGTVLLGFAGRLATEH
jgi:threonine/homoserine/homoserine lactone efflux protein